MERAYYKFKYEFYKESIEVAGVFNIPDFISWMMQFDITLDDVICDPQKIEQLFFTQKV